MRPHADNPTLVARLGVLVVEGDSQKMHSFWADSPAEEVQVIDAFLDLLDGREDLALFHYGSYERKLLKRMRKVVKRKGLVDRVLEKVSRYGQESLTPEERDILFRAGEHYKKRRR